MPRRRQTIVTIVTSGDDHQVLQFRPGGRRARLSSPPRPDEPQDLSRYEAADDEPDDFRHRMIMNAFAFAAAVVLIAAGVWLAVALTDLRKSQDCVLMGRRDCTTASGRG